MDLKTFYEKHPQNTTANFLKNHYAPVRRLLKDCLEVEEDDFAMCLKPVDSVIKKVKATYKNPNTLKFYLQALLFLIDEYPGLAEKVNRQKYYDAWEASKVVKAEFDEQKPVKGQVSIDEIQEKVDEEFGDSSIESLYISVYREAPVRLDYQDIKVYGTMKQVPKDEPKYLVLQSKKLVMNEYNKTSKKYGTKEVKLSDEVMEKVKQSLKKNPRDQLFVFSNSNPTKAISNILRKAGIEKGSLNTLRHAVSSEDRTPEERVKLARVAGHAPDTSVSYKRPPKGMTKMNVPDELVDVIEEMIEEYSGGAKN